MNERSDIPCQSYYILLYQRVSMLSTDAIKNLCTMGMYVYSNGCKGYYHHSIGGHISCQCSKETHVRI